MIYSATHRLSLLESLLNMIGPAATFIFTGWAILFSSLIPNGTSSLVLLVWVLAALIFCTVTHELGHLGVGLLVHRPVRKILIGSGRTVYSSRPGGLRVQVCANLLGGGAVYFSAIDDTSVEARILVTAAGPAVNLLTGAIALAALPSGIPWMGTFALFSLMLGAVNSLPSRFDSGGTQHVSDGMQIWRMTLGRPMTSTFFEGEVLAPDGQRVTIGAIEEAMDSESEQLTEVHLLASLDRDPDIHRLLAPARIADLLRWPGPPSSLDVRPVRSPVVEEIFKVTFRIGRDLGLSRPNAACLCLALMKVQSPVAARLNESGVSEAALRELAAGRAAPAGEDSPGGATLPDLPLERWGSAADRVLALAFRIATIDRAEDTGTQHMVAAMMAERGSRAALALSHMGFALHRNDRAVKPGDPPDTPPKLTPEAESAIAGALLVTGPTYPTGTGELCLSVAQQTRSMAALLFLVGDIGAADLQDALVATPREPSEPTGYTESMRQMWALRASARLGAGRYAEARADFLLLEQNAPSDATRAVNLHNVAWVSLLSGDPSWRQEALEKARAALAINPEQHSFVGTYGFALLETGATAEAAEVLEKVVVDHPRPRDRALDLCLLAMGRARLGELEAARASLRAAAEADPRCVLLERARGEVERAPAQAATN